MLLVDIVALQRSFPTFPVKVILIEPDGLTPPQVPEVAGDPGEQDWL
jgi:hypothetical protein